MEETKSDSFVFYRSFLDAISALPEGEQISLYRAVCYYALDRKIIELNGAANGMFALIKPQIDANIKRRENARKGGAPKGNNNARKQPKNNRKQAAVNLKNNQKQPNVNVNANVNVNDNVNDNANVNNIPPLSPKGGESAQLFKKFYSAYPKKKSKEQARKAFEKLKPDDELLGVMLAALEKQKQSDEWQRDGGQFVPYPASWLNGRRWEDETTDKTAEDKPDKYAGISWGIVL